MVQFGYLPTWFTLFFIAGIACSNFFKINSEFLLFGLIFLTLITSVLHRKVNSFPKFSIPFSIITLLFFFILGFANKQLNELKNQSDFFENQLKPQNFYQLQIKQKLKPTANFDKFEAKITQMNQVKTQGNILVYWRKDSLKETLKTDDLIWSSEQPQEIPKNSNPFSFDYQNYLEKQQIYHQVFLKGNAVVKSNFNEHTWEGKSDRIRRRIVHNLGKGDFSKEPMAIVQAMFLGQKQELSQALIHNYKNAGLMHILAISGLHIGILLLILKWVTQPLLIFKKGYQIQFFMLICILWFYAFLIGFTPSAVRAVTMFSAVLVGTTFKRKIKVQNSLVISLFILLLLNPGYLMQVGFQMSYMAVFFIVGFQPLIFKMVSPKNSFLKYFWRLISVTLAAQLGVLPLSLYYFHEFSGIFLVSAIFVLPVLGILLGLGFFNLILAYFDLLPNIFASFFGKWVYLLNQIVAFLGSFDDFTIGPVFLSGVLVLFFYLIFFNLYAFWKHQSFSFLRTGSILIVLVQIFLIYEKSVGQLSGDLWILNNFKNTLLVQKEGIFAKIWVDQDGIKGENKILNDFLEGSKIKDREFLSPNLNMLEYKEKKLLILSQPFNYELIDQKVDLILLSNSPKLHLEKLIDHFQPKVIVADGSNDNFLLNVWQNTCIKKHIQFISTAQTDAFRVPSG